MASEFDSTAYGTDVAAILALDGDGYRMAPLATQTCSSAEARSRLQSFSASRLFGGSAHPDAALAGLYLYFSCFPEAHSIAQDLHTQEGSFWHAILHRQEPDAFNSGYWFRQTGSHAVFPLLLRAAADIEQMHSEVKGLGMKDKWDPFKFIDYCEEARKSPGSAAELLAREIQRAEWQILFHYCARTS